MRWFTMIAAVCTMCQVTLGDPSTAFSYQGVLQRDGVPIDGSVNARFRIVSTSDFNADAGASITLPVLCEGGRFVAVLDFGQTLSERLSDDFPDFIQIEVELADGTFQWVGPNQRLLSAPSAAVTRGIKELSSGAMVSERSWGFFDEEDPGSSSTLINFGIPGVPDSRWNVRMLDPDSGATLGGLRSGGSGDAGGVLELFSAVGGQTAAELFATSSGWGELFLRGPGAQSVRLRPGAATFDEVVDLPPGSINPTEIAMEPGIAFYSGLGLEEYCTGGPFGGGTVGPSLVSDVPFVAPGPGFIHVRATVSYQTLWTRDQLVTLWEWAITNGPEPTSEDVDLIGDFDGRPVGSTATSSRDQLVIEDIIPVSEAGGFPIRLWIRQITNNALDFCVTPNVDGMACVYYPTAYGPIIDRD